MRPAGSFEKLERVVLRRLARLKAAVILVAAPTTSRSDRDRGIGFAVLEAQNLWANFVRSYLLSLLSYPKRPDGSRVVLGNKAINTPADLLYAAAKVAKGPAAAAPTSRRDEPAWHDINILLRTCVEIQPSHEPDIRRALSTQARVFYDLPTFRNFYAHRNQESARKALDLARYQYLISGAKHPTDALCTPARKRPQALVLDWLDEIEVVVELLCE